MSLREIVSVASSGACLRGPSVGSEDGARRVDRGGEFVQDLCHLGAGAGCGGVGGQQRVGACPGGDGAAVGDVVPGGRQAGGEVQPFAVGGGPDCFLVSGGGAGEGVGGVVDGGEHGADAGSGGGEVCRVADGAG